MRSRWGPRARALALSVLVAPAGCGAGPTREAARKEPFGDLSGTEEIDLAPYLAAAGAIVRHEVTSGGESAPLASAPVLPGARVFLTVYSTEPPVVTTGLGASLMDGVIAASQEAAARLATSSAAPSRLKLDVVRSVEATPLQRELRVRPADAGLFAVRRSGCPAPGLPLLPHNGDHHRPLHRRLERVGRDRRGSARSRSCGRWPSAPGSPRGSLDSCRRTESGRLRPSSRLRRAVRSPSIARCSTGPTPCRPTLSSTPSRPPLTTSRACSRTMDATLTWSTPKPTPSTWRVRHASPCGARRMELLEAYGELRVPLYREKAESALHYLKAGLSSTPNGTFLAEDLDEEQQKVGGGGLARFPGPRAVRESDRFEGRSGDHAEASRASSSTSSTRTEHFREQRGRRARGQGGAARGKKAQKTQEVSYFAGEAILGLVRLYAIDPQPQWLGCGEEEWPSISSSPATPAPASTP